MESPPAYSSHEYIAPVDSIIVWFRPRKLPEGYKGVQSIPRTAPGTELRQRPRDQKVEPLEQKQYDHVYHSAHVGAVQAEMVRPNVSGPNWGGYTVDKLRVAGGGGSDQPAGRAQQLRRTGVSPSHSCSLPKAWHAQCR